MSETVIIYALPIGMRMCKTCIYNMKLIRNLIKFQQKSDIRLFPQKTHFYLTDWNMSIKISMKKKNMYVNITYWKYLIVEVHWTKSTWTCIRY